MGSTLLLDRSSWDLVLDASGNIAVATEPYSLAQDAASAIKTFSDGGANGLGECYWDTTLGVPWRTRILGKPVSLPLLKELLVAAAKTVPDVASAQVFITAFTNRQATGQVQVPSISPGQVSPATLSFILL